MANYIVLAKYTRNGIDGMKGIKNRLQKSKTSAENMGARMVSMWWTLGEYDLVAVMEAPDDETITAWLVAVGMRDIVTTRTMRAFSEKEFMGIVDRLP